jgi:hypothetical protein
MPYLSDRQRTSIITLVKDVDSEVQCDVVQSQDNHDGFHIILTKGNHKISLDITEDDLEHAADDPKTQSEMRWRFKKAIEGSFR